MKLKAIYDTKEDIPAGFESAYTERNGKWELQVEGMKTQADVDRVQTALEAERVEHKETKKQSRGGDDAAQDLKDKVEDLEAKLETAGQDKVSDDDIQKRVDAQVKLVIRPIEREKSKLEETNAEQLETIGTQAKKINSGLIRSDVTEVLGTKELGINPDALPDIEIYAERVMVVGVDGKRLTKDGVGVTPGLTLAELIAEMRADGQRNHWFGKTQGAGSPGGEGGSHGGVNPFKEGETWNSTEQGVLITNNPNLAKSLAEQAGGRGLKLYKMSVGAA